MTFQLCFTNILQSSDQFIGMPDLIDLIFFDLLMNSVLLKRMNPSNEDEITIDCQKYIFVKKGRRINGEQVSNYVQSVFMDFSKKKIGVQRYRHIALLMFEQWVYKFPPRENFSTAIFNIQGGHSVATTSRVYARTQDDMRLGPRHAIPFFEAASTIWHQVIGRIPQSLESLPAQQLVVRSENNQMTSQRHTITINSNPLSIRIY